MSYPPGDGRPAPSNDPYSNGPGSNDQQWGVQQPPVWGGPPAGNSGPQAVCSWHPDRATGLRCTRCGRPACPECLTSASVGQQCRACIAEGRQGQRVARTVAGSPVGRPPLIASILIAVNLIAYIATAVDAQSINEPQLGAWFNEFALIPLAVGDGEYWRILTSGFLHLGVIHIAANMMSLYFLGPPLEKLLGRLRFTAVYVISLIGGSTAVMLFSDERTLSAGASGAIFGLMGALVVTFRKLRVDLRQLGGVLVVNLVITFTIPNISWQAHLGGLVAGAAIGAAMVLPNAARRAAVQIGATVAVLALCIGLIVWRAGEVGSDGRCFYDGDGSDGPGVYCYTGAGNTSS